MSFSPMSPKVPQAPNFLMTPKAPTIPRILRALDYPSPFPLSFNSLLCSKYHRRQRRGILVYHFYREVQDKERKESRGECDAYDMDDEGIDDDRCIGSRRQ